MVTQQNFLDYLPGLKPAAFDEELKMLHFFVMESTEMGTNWAAYPEPEVKPMVDQYFEKLNEFLGEGGDKPAEKLAKLKKEAKREVEKVPTRVIDSETKQEIERRPPKKSNNHVRRSRPAPVEELEYELTERIPDEIRFIRRFVSLKDKKKTKHELLLFINALHRAFIEKRVRKTSPYADHLMAIQRKLVSTFNSMGKTAIVPISEKMIGEFKEVISSEKVFPSIQLIKRYITLNGKYGVKEKAKNLIIAMTRAFERGRVSKSDRYVKQLDQMFKNLNTYLKSKTQKILTIEEGELNGLNGIIEEVDNSDLSGVTEKTVIAFSDSSTDTEQLADKKQSGVMSSMDFKKLQFDTIGFVGKYKDFIGDPSPGFTAMVFGRPKMGKSIFCIDFAGYLARQHGKVLYVAKEEGLDYTLQEKLKANDVAHPNLDISETIPEELSNYDFVFLDSVNSLGLSNSDLVALKDHNPGISFIQIFQTTKTGSHRGDNESQHNVDIVIEVPEKGLAVQNGRFNQGGKLKIFEDSGYKDAA